MTITQSNRATDITLDGTIGVRHSLHLACTTNIWNPRTIYLTHTQADRCVEIHNNLPVFGKLVRKTTGTLSQTEQWAKAGLENTQRSFCVHKYIQYIIIYVNKCKDYRDHMTRRLNHRKRLRRDRLWVEKLMRTSFLEVALHVCQPQHKLHV